jgi:8-oxo-dGTP pyrophosphatase MutT (NUDIX family)
MKYLLEYTQYINNICKSVCALIINEANEILILKRGSTAPWMPNKWSLCGGIIDKNETKKYAIIREIKEELNLEVDIKDILPYNELYDKEENYYLTCYKIKTSNIDITLDAQNDEFEWVNYKNFINFDYVPHTKEFIQNYFKSQKLAA